MIRARLQRLVLALLLAYVVAPPSDSIVQAQERELRVTFRLTLRGDVPAGEEFQVQFYPDRPGDDRENARLCGGNEPGALRRPPCTVGGVYEKTIPWLDPESGVAFHFFRNPDRASSETFYGGQRDVSGDTVVEAYYDYGGAVNGQQAGTAGDQQTDPEPPKVDGQGMPELPATGSGGLSGGPGGGGSPHPESG